MKKIFLVSGIVFVLVIGGILLGKGKKEEKALKIGVISPLTGGVAYWGESSLIGIKYAKEQLRSKGIEVDVVIEDGQLDPRVALNAVQKLVNVDKVDAVYSEFNPAAIAASSFLKDKDIVHIYDATPISPLELSNNFYKTYLDYEVSCRRVSEILKDRGYKKIGVLKMNLEHGDLCLKGIQEVFGPNAVVESYNSGVTDFRVMLVKLNSSEVDAIFHASFQPETLSGLKMMRDLGIKKPFIGLTETMTPDVVVQYKDMLQGAIVFGLPKVSPDLISKMNSFSGNNNIVDENAAALAYLHILQLADALQVCGKDTVCVRQKLDKAEPNNDVGFQGFKDRVAGFDTLIQEWNGNAFVSVSE